LNISCDCSALPPFKTYSTRFPQNTSHLLETQKLAFGLPPYLYRTRQVQMDNQWTIPPADPQRSHVVQNHACRIFKCLSQCLVLQIPPTAGFPAPAFQPNMPTYQQGEDPAIQNCSCVQCSGVRRTQAHPPTSNPDVSGLYDDDTVPTTDYVFFRKSTRAPYVSQDQDIGNSAETALIVPDRVRAQFAPPQTDVRTNILPRIRIAEVLT
jgi:hypothetical protein